MVNTGIFIHDPRLWEGLFTSETRGVPGVEVFRDGGPVELVRDMVGGVRIFRPNLSKRFAEAAVEGRDAPGGAEVGGFK